MADYPIPVFLDTDIGPDCDDTAALAILLQLCRENYARLLGVTHCTGSPYGLGTVDAICRLFGVRVPLGTCSDPGFLSSGSALCYTPAVCGKFPHSYPPGVPQPDAMDAFVRAMEGLDRNSVTLITIGPLNNVVRFLTDGRASGLMKKCVSRIVTMGGSFLPGFAEWNVRMDIPAMRYIAENWHKDLILCPFEAAVFVETGAPLEKYPGNPVRTAYDLYTKGSFRRSSWDPVTVACAVLDDTGPYEISAPGFLRVDRKGVTSFQEDPAGRCRYIRLKGTAEEAADWINQLLERAVVSMTGRQTEEAQI